MIADDNKEFCVLVQEYIEEQADMELVEVAYNGMEAVSYTHLDVYKRQA